MGRGLPLASAGARHSDRGLDCSWDRGALPFRVPKYFGVEACVPFQGQSFLASWGQALPPTGAAGPDGVGAEIELCAGVTGGG